MPGFGPFYSSRLVAQATGLGLLWFLWLALVASPQARLMRSVQ